MPDRAAGRLLIWIAAMTVLLGCSKDLAFDPLKPRPTPVPIPSATAPSFTALPWPFPSPELPRILYRRALVYDRAMQQNHVPNGLVMDVRFSNAERGHPIVEYGGTGDLAFNTGGYVAAEGFRLAVTGDPEAADNLKRSLEALHRAQAITGVKGLLARGFWKASDPAHGPTTFQLRHGEGEFAGYDYVTETSRGQYISVMFGYGVAYDFLKDEKVKAMVRQDVADIANHIWDHGLKIVDQDGKPTQYGKIEAGPFYGYNAMIALNFFRLAARITGDSHFEDVHRQLIKRYYDQYVAAMIAGFSDVTKYYNYNLAAMSLYHLLGLESDRKIRRHYETGFDYGWWRWVKDDDQSFFNFIYAAVRGGQDKDRAIERAIDTLARFPEQLPFHAPRVINSDKAWLVDHDDPFSGLRGQTVARFPLPPGVGPVHDFRWQRNPRELDGGSNDDFTEFPGSDYQLAYWMGRYYGYIPAP